MDIRGRLLRNEPMSLHTSLKVGGPADLFAIPEDAEDLQSLLIRLTEQHITWITIGRGYNLLVRDKGIRGAVVSLERFNRIETLPHPPPNLPLERGGNKNNLVLQEVGGYVRA